MSDNIKVVVKVRPLICREIDQKLSYQWRVRNDTLFQLDQNGKDSGSYFTFDKVYDKETETIEVYDDIAKPIVEAAIAGFNGTIFAYGQTSSGKTYTMSGTEESPGIITLAVLNLFKTIKAVPNRDFLVRVSYIEIYNETVKDLLNVEKKNIKVQETLQGVKVDATERPTGSPEEVLEAMKEGEANRQTGATNMNEESSRSHSIFQITIESREHLEGEEEVGSVNVSQLNLVDLAGSERSGQTGATGLRFKEGTHINKSLSVLALVIKQLSEDPNKHANYRDSKLTRILQNSLGGNAKTSIICAITPASIDETISTLQFANRAKAIKNKPQVNAVATSATEIHSLTKQLSQLQSQLETKKNLEQDNVNLQKRIASLQNLILNGFGQSNIEMMCSSRKKPQPPLRRMTIGTIGKDTLHPIQEDPIPTVPRFCTPTLKYNPMTLGASTDFLPIQSCSKLASLPEETALVTPPPYDNKEEIIVIDSDDDSSSVQPCSPYHVCYNKSTTPPCILRISANQAEKNLKDLLAHTEREKMYTPSVVELIEKLDQHTSVMVKLEETVATLTKESKRKDSEIELLKNKISKTEEEINAVTLLKSDLEFKCKDYNTRLTDWEVSYDTLKRKAKTREEELLSLLEEQKTVTKAQDISKLAPKPVEKELCFMNLSKDISLVNSDNDSSTAIANEDDPSTQIQEMITDMQTQLTAKNQIIIDLEANIFSQKQKIESMDSSYQDLQGMIESFKDKLAHMENENSFLKSTVDNLNSTLESQKLTLESTDNDIKSYNNLIQELQIKLTKKDSTLNVTINDSVLESLIANEEKFITNNENLKNIIQTFRMTLDSRNKEINQLQATMRDHTESTADNITLKQEINILIEESEKLKSQIIENISVINKLTTIEQETTKNLTETREQYNLLKKQDEEKAITIEKLKEDTENLTLCVSEKEFSVLEISIRNEDLTKEILGMTKKIADLEEDINSKNSEIKLLSHLDRVAQENLRSAKTSNNKLLEILLLFNSDNVPIRKSIDNLELFFDLLDVGLNEIESTARKIIEENKVSQTNLARDKEELCFLKEKYENKLTLLEKQIEDHIIERSETLHQLDQFTHQSTELSGQLDTIRNELDSKTKKIFELETKLNDSKENNENLHNDILSKNDLILSLQIEKTALCSEVESLSLLIQNTNLKNDLNNVMETQEALNLAIKDKEILEISEKLKATELLIQEKHGEVIALKTEIDDLKQIICEKHNEILTREDEQNIKIKKLEHLLEDKQNEIDVMKKEFASVKETMVHENESLLSQIGDKANEIFELNNLITDMENRLVTKYTEVAALTKELNEAIENRDKILENILTKSYKLLKYDFNSKKLEPIELNCGNTFEQIVACLDEVANRLTMLQSIYDTNDIEKVLSRTRAHLTDVTEKNVNLQDQFSTADARNQELLKEIENIRTTNNNLSDAGDLLEELKLELSMKTNELQSMELKARELKCQFMEFDSLMRQQMQELHKENERLKQGFPLIVEQSKEQVSGPNYLCSDDISEATADSSYSPYFTDIIEKDSPQSLLTICCNKIIEQLQRNDNESSVTPSSSRSNADIGHDVTQVKICLCIELSEKLKTISDENQKLRDNLKTLEYLNQRLVKEQEDTRNEVALLLETTKELQKKIANHRTHLSTLTATTYAENKSLNSQLKVLKHHHTRYIHVCQKDLPAFKSQLYDLITVLNETSSLSDKQNGNFKRYSLPDVLDSNTTVNTFKNDSVLDGDLLMLDTNVTLTTADNTLLGLEQTCLETTQINFDNEVACQTTELSEFIDPSLIYTQIGTLSNENQTLYKNLKKLKAENLKLKEEIIKSSVNITKADALRSSTKLKTDEPQILTKLKTEDDELLPDKLAIEVNNLSQELASVKAQKEVIEKKYSDLVLEMPSTEALARKINILEKECNNKVQEIAKLTNDLHNTAKVIKELQNENDIMSTQFMENISEADDLRRDLETLRDKNIKLTEKCEQLQLRMKEIEVVTNMNSSFSCPHCPKKDEVIHHLRSKHRQEPNSKLNRSLSDSDSSSRYNKIATLQQELHDSKEDCKKITHEVATIKNHLERSNLSMSQTMDLDESMGDSNIFNFTKDFDAVEPQGLNKFNLANIPEETDMYAIDKINCINYYIEKTGSGKENLNCDTNIIDVMKRLYDNIVAKHGNDVENLLNRLRIVEESRNQLQSQINVVNSEYSKVTKELDSKGNDLRTVTNVLTQIRNSINVVEEELSNIVDIDKNNKLISMFKESLLTVLDTQFGLTTANIFECLIDNIVTKHQDDLSEIVDKYTKLQEEMKNMLTELNGVTDNLNEVKTDLAKKETEYNLLKDQKQKVHEICNAVTLDIIKKEQNLCETIKNSCQKLIELNVVKPEDIDLTQAMDKNLHVLLERLTNEFQKHDISSLHKEKENLILETKKSYIIIEEKEQELDTLRIDLLDKEKKLEAQMYLHEDLNKVYEFKVKENNANLNLIQNLKDELNVLKENVLKKESAIEVLKCQLHTQNKDALFEKENKVTELKQQIDILIQENENIKSINQMMSNEKEAISLELQRSGETIEHNKAELERMAADILVLRESVKDNVFVIESLSLEAKSLMEHNIKLKEEFESKIQDCARLEINIKTHEKTAEIQSRMIIRLQKQKDEDDKQMRARDKQLEELSDKYVALQKECEAMKDHMKTSKDEIEKFKSIKNTLEIRVSELEDEMETGNKHRLSIEALTDDVRRRRQSIYDSQRMFNEEKHEFDDDNQMQAIFESRSNKPDDLFMDVDDEGGSGKSTPLRLSRGHDSFRVELGTDEEPVSRPSSVLATRRRRQSTHDQHRGALRHTPEPHDNSLRRLSGAITTLKPDEPQNNSSSESEVFHLKQRLASCEQELEELQQQYRELDEECETCAAYLRERDEQCARLKRENTALEKEVKELRENVKCSQNGSHVESKLTVAHASVNTDEDWANLHAVVVDRMSFDAEVEKNKKLTRTIEELRYKKQDLENALAKMHKALDKHAGSKDNRELEMAKSELKACKQELAEMRVRCRELDEECDTCGEYLRERDAQCRRLRDAKAALETKLQELQDNASGISQLVRKKRQSVHDLNRAPTAGHLDASTEISDDLLSYQVERDVSSQTVNDSLARELNVLRTTLERVTKEKQALEHSLPAQPAVYVATGSAIVQNQQLTDVMKENQKLKKVNAKLFELCKKRGKSLDANRENKDPTERA